MIDHRYPHVGPLASRAWGDPWAEAEFFGGVRAMFPTSAVVLITHRLTSVTGADMIYVMDQGQIAEYGTHDDLRARNGLYERLFATQLGQLRDSGESDRRAAALAGTLR